MLAANNSTIVPAADETSNSRYASTGFDATNAVASPAASNANGALTWPVAPAAIDTLPAASAPHVASTATATSERTAPQSHHPQLRSTASRRSARVASAADEAIRAPAADAVHSPTAVNDEDDASDAMHASAGFDATDAAASPAASNGDDALAWPDAPAATYALPAAFTPQVASATTATYERTARQPNRPQPRSNSSRRPAHIPPAASAAYGTTRAPAADDADLISAGCNADNGATSWPAASNGETMTAIVSPPVHSG
jgi:DNA polymerase III subunit gamma/tau